MKRIVIAGAMAASSFIGLGAFVAPAAHADDTCNGVQVNYNVTINGQTQAGSQCLAAPSLPSVP